jgi:5'-3' exonuclease
VEVVLRVNLVDGTFELFRCFYGAPKSEGPGGREVGATKAILRTLLKLLSEDDEPYLAVAFDRVIESFRNDLFDGYKTGAGIEPTLLEQFPLAERAARALGVITWPMVKYEADDALATAAFLWKDRAERIRLCVPDKDLAQCVDGERVVLFDRIRQKTYNEAGVREKWGVAPASIPDWLALVGDKADGIPGIPRWGAKSASALLDRYGCITEIPDDSDLWDVKVRGAKTLAENLRERRGEAELYQILATLRTDVPIPQDLDELRWRGADRELLGDLCAAIGDTRFMDRITLWR